MALPRQRSSPPPFPVPATLEGKGRADFELVVARYDEDIRWTDAYAPFRTVYNKGASDLSCAFVYLPNKGHLADTILQHIVRRYDSLATTTFFCHGAINYRNDQQISPERWAEFIQVEPRALSFLAATDLPQKGATFGSCTETVGDVYSALFGGARYQPTFDWAKGLWISVGRSRIRKQPRVFYERMLNWVLAPLKGQEPDQGLYRDRGIYIERFLLRAFR